jgi:uncharacterized protein (TIGR02118 family)
MIKIMGLLTRKEGITREEFVRHWFDIHAPLSHAVPGIRRYVQSHITGTRTRPTSLKPGSKSMASLNFGMTIWTAFGGLPRRPK